MVMEMQDIIKRFVINFIMLFFQVCDYKVEVVKFIDVFICIGCKVCQVVCLEWNDICDIVGNNIGVYDNFNDLSVKLWMVMCFLEVEQNDKLEWLICKDGCMYCFDSGCLKVCLVEGVIIQYVNGIVDFQFEQCIGCGYCIVGCLFDILCFNLEDNCVYKCMLCVDCVVVG